MEADREYNVALANGAIGKKPHSEPERWAQENPEAWQALKEGKAGVYNSGIYERLDKPFTKNGEA